MSASSALSDRRVHASFGRWLAFVTDLSLILIIVLVPGLAAATFERAELFKQATFVALVGIALVARTIRSAVERRSEIRMGWSEILLALFGIGFFITSLVSAHPYLSFVGQFSQRAWSYLSVGSLLIFAWLVAQRGRMIISSSGFLLAFLLGSLGITGAGAWSVFSGQSVTVAGSIYALSLCVALGNSIALGAIVFGRERLGGLFSLRTWPGAMARGIAWAVWILSFIVLLRIQFWMAWMMVLVGSVCLGGLMVLTKQVLFKKTKRGVWLVLALLVAAAGLAFPIAWKNPVAGEVGLSFSASWQITQQAIAAHPWWGTGPGTWAYDYAAYRSPQFNLTPFWANRFDRGSSQFLTLFSTTGMVVSGFFLLFLFAMFGVSVYSLLGGRARSASQNFLEDDVLQIIMLSGWTAMSIVLFFYNMNLSHQVMFWALMGCLLGFSSHVRVVVDGMRRPWKWMLPLKAVCMTVGVLSVFVLGGQALWAQAKTQEMMVVYQRGEISAEEVIHVLEGVRAVHAWDDASARVLAQAYLVRVLQIVKDAPVSERAQAVNERVTKMVDVALEATRLAPTNADNWANAGIVYASIASFTQGADGFAMKHYQDAIQRDPQHPDYPYQIGALFLLKAQQLKVLFEAKEAAVREQAVQQEQQALTEAARWTKVSLSLKPDYVPARYQEAVILHRQGKNAEALGVLESLVAQDPTPDRIFELGVLAVQAGQPERAIAAFERVLALDGSQTRARWQLASLYEEVGRLSEALTQLRLVAESVPTNTAVQARLQSLENRLQQVR